MAGVRVREVRETDAAAITQIHCADETQWRAYERGGRATTYERLSPSERWLHGGAWMDERLCRAYLAGLRAAGHRALGAEVDGALRGHVELFDDASDLHVGLLWVHARYRRRGLGRCLLTAAAEVAGSRLLTVRPDVAATAFYRSAGFRPWRQLPGWTARVPDDVAPSNLARRVPPDEPAMGRLHVGATTVSSHIRFLRAPPPFDLPLFAQIVHAAWPDRRLVLVPDWSANGGLVHAYVFATGPLADVDLMLRAAKRAGFAAVRCYADAADGRTPPAASPVEAPWLWRRPPP